MERLTQKVESLGDIWMLENGRTKEMVTESNEYKEYFEKLAEYEELEEQGLLLRLPCKVGSDVFCISSRYTLCSEYGEERNDFFCQGCESLECDSIKEHYIKDEINVSPSWIVSNIKHF